jgi:hypothetical protein
MDFIDYKDTNTTEELECMIKLIINDIKIKNVLLYKQFHNDYDKEKYLSIIQNKQEMITLNLDHPVEYSKNKLDNSFHTSLNDLLDELNERKNIYKTIEYLIIEREILDFFPDNTNIKKFENLKELCISSRHLCEFNCKNLPKSLKVLELWGSCLNDKWGKYINDSNLELVILDERVGYDDDIEYKCEYIFKDKFKNWYQN